MKIEEVTYQHLRAKRKDDQEAEGVYLSMGHRIKVVSTRDVSLEILREQSEEFAPEIELEVDGRQIYLMSAEPPSWLVFLSESSWWIQALAAYAVVYVAEIVKEAAKETWKSRAKALGALKTTGNRIRHLAEGIAQLRARVSARTRIEVGLPFPDEYFATRLELTGSTAEEIALEVALFVHHLPGLEALISSRGLDSDRPATGLHLELLPDASLQVSWHDAQTLEQRQVILPFGELE